MESWLRPHSGRSPRRCGSDHGPGSRVRWIPGGTLTAHAVARRVGALLAGMAVSLLIPFSLALGVRYALAQEAAPSWQGWSWQPHWVARALAGIVASIAGGYLAGALARRRGLLVGMAAAAPGEIALLWPQSPPDQPPPAAVWILAVCAIALAGRAGKQGQGFGERHAPHFDRRPGTIAGVRWLHLLWFPVLVHFCLAHSSWTVVRGAQWITAAWQTGGALRIAVGLLFVTGFWATLTLTWSGAWEAYAAVAGLGPARSRPAALAEVFKNGLGLPLVAGGIQLLISLLYRGVLRFVL